MRGLRVAVRLGRVLAGSHPAANQLRGLCTRPAKRPLRAASPALFLRPTPSDAGACARAALRASAVLVQRRVVRCAAYNVFLWFLARRTHSLAHAVAGVPSPFVLCFAFRCARPRVLRRPSSGWVCCVCMCVCLWFLARLTSVRLPSQRWEQLAEEKRQLNKKVDELNKKVDELWKELRPLRKESLRLFRRIMVSRRPQLHSCASVPVVCVFSHANTQILCFFAGRGEGWQVHRFSPTSVDKCEQANRRREQANRRCAERT